jgi:hypothetical protein
MQEAQYAVEFKNINVRLDRIEQILPTLATKDDLKGMPTRDDLKGFLTQADVTWLATKDDLKAFATKVELKAESQETRRYMKILVEDLRGDIKLIAEGLADTNRRLISHDHLDIRADLNKVDWRVLKLELKDTKRSRRAS